MLAGVVAMIALGMLVPLGPFPRIERAYIEQTFFERDGAIAREKIDVSPALLRRSDVQRRMPPPSWPF